MFWNEYRDEHGRTIGYEFQADGCRTFLQSSLVTGSANVTLDGAEVAIMLGNGSDEVLWECVQGFDSEVYRDLSCESDCLLLVFNWSRNAIGFELESIPGGARLPLGPSEGDAQ